VSRLERLFSPIRIGAMEIRNRLAMAPMSTDYADDEGAVTDGLVRYYEARAAGGVGLVIAEVFGVDGSYPYMPRTLGLWSDDLVGSHRRLVDAVHAHGARIVPQISHPGPESLCTIFTGIEAVGPSAGIVNSLTGLECRELGVEEIRTIVVQYGEAARRAREAGFDGVEIHAAHGYMLVGSFLSAIRNGRTDGYGGSPVDRLRFLVEILGCVRDRAGEDFPIILRISGDDHVPGGRDLDGTLEIVPVLERAGVDAFHVSGGVYPTESWRVIPPSGTPRCINAAESAAIRKRASVPVLLVGRITDPLEAEGVLERGEADMAVMGRALLADPDLPKKAAGGRLDDIAPCIGCGLGCVVEREQGGDMTCVVNPACGREDEAAIVEADGPRKVMVVGGGPAGLEAARVAALRGHHVSLYEREGRLGGQYNLAAVAPSKTELARVVAWYAVQLERAGVEVHLGTEVTAGLVDEVSPDVVVVATGARPCGLDVPGADLGLVACAHDVLAGLTDASGRSVLVVGGGMTGLDVAEHLAHGGADVTVVEMLDEVGQGMFNESRVLLLRCLEDRGVRILTSSTVRRILEDGAVIEREGGEEVLGGMDLVVIATGVEPVNGLAARLEGREVHVVGDALEPRRALHAIREGAEIARRI
jgi:NAD(H)-dependent 7beta-hydroxy-3-oxo-delta4-cholenoic acid oxidoreductase